MVLSENLKCPKHYQNASESLENASESNTKCLESKTKCLKFKQNALNLFRTHNNYITIRNRTNPEKSKKQLITNEKQLQRIINNQKPNTDIYINKYPSDKLIDCIILDFDSEKNLQPALDDAAAVMLYVEDHGLDTAIISSGSKGYHVYIRIPLTDFKGYGKPSFTKNLFNKFIESIIGGADKYPTLDKINFSSGLKGNIRVIGSEHPVTGNKCELLEGYSGYELNQEYIDECLSLALVFAEDKEEERKERLRQVKPLKMEYGSNYIEDNDLRLLMPRLFGGEIKHFNHYSMMCCPFHNDSNPSLMVGKEWFKCQSCGTKGNIWYLINNGYIKRENL